MQIESSHFRGARALSKVRVALVGVPGAPALRESVVLGPGLVLGLAAALCHGK